MIEREIPFLCPCIPFVLLYCCRCEHKVGLIVHTRGINNVLTHYPRGGDCDYHTISIHTSSNNRTHGETQSMVFKRASSWWRHESQLSTKVNSTVVTSSIHGVDDTGSGRHITSTATRARSQLSGFVRPMWREKSCVRKENSDNALCQKSLMRHFSCAQLLLSF